MALTNKQQAFVDEYLKCWNAAEAARRAGYSENSARNIGHENLTKPDITEEISKRVRERAMSADEALLLLADHARGDIGDFLDVWDGGFKINVHKAIEGGKSHLIKKLGFNKYGKPEIELYDAKAAIDTILKAHNVFKERIEHTGKDGGPIETRQTSTVDLKSLSDDELDMLDAIVSKATSDQTGD